MCLWCERGEEIQEVPVKRRESNGKKVLYTLTQKQLVKKGGKSKKETKEDSAAGATAQKRKKEESQRDYGEKKKNIYI